MDTPTVRRPSPRLILRKHTSIGVRADVCQKALPVLAPCIIPLLCVLMLQSPRKPSSTSVDWHASPRPFWSV